MRIAVLIAVVPSLLTGVAAGGGSGGGTPSSCPFVNPKVVKYTSANDLKPQVLFNNYFPATDDLLIGTYGNVYSYKSGQSKTLGYFGDHWGGVWTNNTNPNPKGTYLISTEKSIFRSADGGASFTNIPLTAPSGEYPLQSTAGNMFQVIGRQIVWGTQNGFYVSDDDGLTWSPVDCKALLALSNSGIQTISSCADLFVRSMALSPDSKQVLAVFSALGMSGIYSLDVPIAKVNGTYAPKFGTILYNPICPILPQDANEGTLCSQSGPLAVFNGKVYAGSQNKIVTVPYPAFANGNINATTVLTAPNTAESELVGLSVSLDNKVIAAAWSGAIFSSLDGNKWTQPSRSGCSGSGSYPTDPKGYFTRSIAPGSKSPAAGYATFAIGTSKGPLLWNVKTA
ncbi:hypothetical protein HDU97_005866 [Phlyctochytrium planicorne]|nr:hypothetical protein HDU97_005866 [Phlyctochytrium planicorne]